MRQSPSKQAGVVVHMVVHTVRHANANLPMHITEIELARRTCKQRRSPQALKGTQSADFSFNCKEVTSALLVTVTAQGVNAIFVFR